MTWWSAENSETYTTALAFFGLAAWPFLSVLVMIGLLVWVGIRKCSFGGDIPRPIPVISVDLTPQALRRGRIKFPAAWEKTMSVYIFLSFIYFWLGPLLGIVALMLAYLSLYYYTTLHLNSSDTGIVFVTGVGPIIVYGVLCFFFLVTLWKYGRDMRAARFKVRE